MELLHAFTVLITIFVGILGKVCAEADFTQWHPPGPGDSRGPCPALNSLANHGILPRNGRGMTIPILIKGISQGLNVGNDLTIPVGTVGLLASDSLLKLSFDLDDLSKHDELIEHDASLSREDIYFGDNTRFNSEIWQSVVDFFRHDERVNTTAAARARFNRVKVQSGRNPEFTYSAKNMIISYTETAQYLSVFGNPLTGNPRVDWVRTFFEEERLPYNEGWRPPKMTTNLATVTAMTLELILAGGEVLPEGLEVTENLVGKILAGKPIEGIIGNPPIINRIL
ncbi:hypothetical protein AJ80_02279 [Polytolypa hystricis UAMH7299]|uniref:Heme haloperoxidase family profile domain-containing protein n=1 Tax=Polytolypa hystricis (strain UAMH7299) TaxID=1447883 RepID=A0A2B7YRQ3_POLH7|nr:hypothetical protein AJ80_02279 [Polytolypa hystricis UAMH7299]